MTMGDRIKTRQQLIDEQVNAVNARVTLSDRLDESAHTHQAHDSTVKHMSQEDAEVQGGVRTVH